MQIPPGATSDLPLAGEGQQTSTLKMGPFLYLGNSISLQRVRSREQRELFCMRRSLQTGASFWWPPPGGSSRGEAREEPTRGLFQNWGALAPACPASRAGASPFSVQPRPADSGWGSLLPAEGIVSLQSNGNLRLPCPFPVCRTTARPNDPTWVMFPLGLAPPLRPRGEETALRGHHTGMAASLLSGVASLYLTPRHHQGEGPRWQACANRRCGHTPRFSAAEAGGRVPRHPDRHRGLTW